MLALLAVSTDFGSRYTSVYVYSCLCIIMSDVSFCLQITLPSVPFRGQNVMVFKFHVDLRESGYMDAFDFEKSRKKSFY